MLLFAFNGGDDFCFPAIVLLIAFVLGKSIFGGREGTHSGAKLVAVLVFGVVAGCSWIQNPDANELPWIVLRGLIAAGIAFFVFNIASPVLRVGRSLGVRLVAPRPVSYRPPPPPPPPPAPPPPDPLEEARHRSDALRRANARFEAETLYRRHFAAIKDAFPPDTFEAYLKKYLGDSEPVEAVEQRLERFRENILELAGATGKSEDDDPLGELIADYQKQLQKIDGANLTGPEKESLRLEASMALDRKMKRRIRGEKP
jgi:hypothetical protein